MTGSVWPLREMTPGLSALFIQAAVGGFFYTIVLIAFDVTGLRQQIVMRRFFR
jgi:hypothetical protein